MYPVKTRLVTVKVTLGVDLGILFTVTVHLPSLPVVQVEEPEAPLLQLPLTWTPLRGVLLASTARMVTDACHWLLR